MKTALYIENGITQVVLTPETEDEKSILAMVERCANAGKLRVLRGSFYECYGGWMRQGGGDDQSLMLVVRAAPAGAE